MDDEKEKNRLSILKIRKSRNPFEEIDVNGEEEDVTSTRVRRVSFASSNQIKQFMADEEKNTIWDSTYEEQLDSESTNKEDIETMSICSMIHNKIGEPQTLNSISKTTQFVMEEDSTMEFTKVVPSNIADCLSEIQKGNNIIYSDDDDMDLTPLVETALHNKSIGGERMLLSTVGKMSFTQPISQNIKENIIESNNVSMDVSYTEVMEFTTPILNPEMIAKQTENDNMNVLNEEFKTTINDKANSLHENDNVNIQNNNKEMSNQDLTNLNNDELELRTAINNQIVDVLRDDNYHHNEEINTNVSIPDMEFDVALRNPQIEAVRNNDHEQDENICKDLSNKNADRGEENTDISARQICLPGPSTNSSLASIGNFGLENITSNDDTQHLINYRLSEKNQGKSDLSQVAAGDFDPSFSKLRRMPLGEYNSNSFHISINDVLKSATPKKKAPNISSETVNNLTLERVQSYKEQDVDQTKFRRQNTVDVNEISRDTDSYFDLCSTQPPENLHDTINSTCTSSFLMKSPKLVTTPLPKCSEISRRSLNEHQSICLDITLQLSSLKIENNIILKKINYNLIDLQKRCIGLMSKKIENLQKCLQGSERRIASVDNSIGSENTLQKLILDEDADRSIELKIRDLQESNKKYWQLVSVDDVTYTFFTLFETIRLTVKIAEDSDKVESIHTETHQADGGLPEALYVRKIFCDKLLPKCIRAALGNRYDIRSLLDYLKETMQMLLDFLGEYDQLFEMYGMIMDKDFRLNFSIVNIDLAIVWKFTINLSELNCISEKTVQYYAKVGSINNGEIRRCMEKCPTGFPFVKTFAESIYDLVNRMKSKN